MRIGDLRNVDPRSFRKSENPGEIVGGSGVSRVKNGLLRETKSPESIKSEGSIRSY